MTQSAIIAAITTINATLFNWHRLPADQWWDNGVSYTEGEADEFVYYVAIGADGTLSLTTVDDIPSSSQCHHRHYTITAETLLDLAATLGGYNPYDL